MAVELVQRFKTEGAQKARRQNDEVRKSVEGVQRSIDKLAKTSADSGKRVAASFAQKTKAMTNTSKRFADVTKRARALGISTRELTHQFNNYKSVLGRTNISARAVNDAQLRMNAALAKTSQQVRGDTAAVGGFTNRLDAMARSVRIIEGPLGGTAARLQTFVAILKSGKAGLVAFALGVTTAVVALGLLAKGMFNAAKAIVPIRSMLEAVTESTELAAAKFRFISEVSSKFGQDIKVLGKQYALLTAASEGTALAGEGVARIFLSTTKAITALHLSAADAEGIMRAFVQMISKGTVQSEELKGQVGERLAGAFNKAARAMGVTVEVLGDMLKQGEILAEELLPKLAKELDRTLGKGAAKASQQFLAAFGRMKTEGTLILDVLDRMVGTSKLLGKIWDGIAETMKTARQFLTKQFAPGKILEEAQGALDLPPTEFEFIAPGLIDTLTDLRDSLREGFEPVGFTTEESLQLLLDVEGVLPRIKTRLEGIKGEMKEIGEQDKFKKVGQELADSLKDARLELDMIKAGVSKTPGLEAFVKEAEKTGAIGAGLVTPGGKIPMAGIGVSAGGREDKAFKLSQDLAKLRDIMIEIEGREFAEKIFLETRTPMEEYTKQVGMIAEATRKFGLSQEDAARAFGAAREELLKTDPVLSSLGRAFDNVAKSIANAMTSGELSMKSFRNIARKVVSDILNDLIKLALFNQIKNAIFGTALPTLGSALNISPIGASTLPSPTIAGAADGGSFKVGAGLPKINAGRDNRLVQFAARDGEQVQVTPMGGKGGGGDTYYIDAKGADPAQLVRLEAMIRQVNGSVEKRAINATRNTQERRLR